jgi:hypothetical protein
VWSRGGLIVCLVIVNVNNITSVDIRMLIYKNEAMTYVCVWLTVTFISRWSLIVINTQYVQAHAHIKGLPLQLCAYVKHVQFHSMKWIPYLDLDYPHFNEMYAHRGKKVQLLVF